MDQKNKKQQLDLLLQAKLIDSSQVEQANKLVQIEEESTAWYVILLIAAGAWISTLLFVVAAAFSGFIDSEIEALILGIILLVATLTISIIKSQNELPEFAKQLLLSTSVTGHLFFLYGMFEMFDHHILSVSILIVAISLAFLYFYQNIIHRMASTWLILSMLGLIIHELGLSEKATLQIGILIIAALTAWVWLKESTYLSTPFHKLVFPIKYALAIAFLTICGIVVNEYSYFLRHNHSNNFLSWNNYNLVISIGLFCVFAFCIINILQRLKINWKSTAGYISIFAALFLTITFHQSPSILAALIVLMIGIERGDKILFSLSVLALIYFYSHYYYRLDMTLMDKSFILMGSGLFLLLTSWLLNRGVKQQ